MIAPPNIVQATCVHFPEQSRPTPAEQSGGLSRRDCPCWQLPRCAYVCHTVLPCAPSRGPVLWQGIAHPPTHILPCLFPFVQRGPMAFGGACSRATGDNAQVWAARCSTARSMGSLVSHPRSWEAASIPDRGAQSAALAKIRWHRPSRSGV
jgi:hypothetical protein